MSDWLHNLPLQWMAVSIFSAVYLTAAILYVVIRALAIGERLYAFKAVSAGLLSPLGTLFALFVAFTAAQVWADTDRGSTAVDREAGALSRVMFLAASFHGEPEARLHDLVQRYIGEATMQEWPRMARQTTVLRITPRPLAKALNLVLALKPDGQGQEIAQREMVTALENALDARRQRIIISRAHVNLVKWCCLCAQALSVLFIVALVHCENGLAARIALGTFATGISVSLLLIAAHDRPFTGEISVQPAPLLQVIPEIAASREAAGQP
jgi:hypothetical protein